MVPTDISATEEFHGLKVRAFSLTPDLRFTYHSRSHTQALEQIGLALKRREGLVVVTGEVGTGKTMLCRALLDGFETRTFISVVLDPLLSVEDLLQQVLTDFGLISARDRNSAAETGATLSRHDMVTTLQQFLSSLIPLNAHAVIMIDEAQHLTGAVLEQVRLLSNFEIDSAKLLQIVLVGQPNLDAMLRRPDMVQLNQRVARRAELSPLGQDEVKDYIERRLAVASDETDKSGQPVDRFAELSKSENVVTFAPEATDLVATISQGIPRLVNTLCDRALEAAYERREHVVDRKAVLTAASRLRMTVPPGQSVSRRSRLAAAVLLLLLLGGVGWWWVNRSPSPAEPPSATSPSQESPTPEPAPPVTTAPPAPAGAPGVSAPAAAPAETSNPGQPATAATPAGNANAGAVASATPASRENAASSGNYEITAASFRTEERAVSVAATLRNAGLPVTSRLDTSGQWYRVVVGPFATTDEARAAQAQLEERGFTGTRIYSNAATDTP